MYISTYKNNMKKYKIIINININTNINIVQSCGFRDNEDNTYYIFI